AATPPPPVRWAGILGMLEGLAGVLFGIFLVIREAQGFHDPGAKISGYGTALWFFFVCGAVLAAGVFLYRGSFWGRGPIVFFQLCLLGVAYYMFRSGALHLGVPTALFAIVGLGLLFNPRSVDWAATRHKI
ncbi:hypothetical protein, partial [Corynebacterium heidelbergense]